jgi:hypothetical protein
MTPEVVERVMGLGVGALGVVAWVALRAEAEGVARAEVAMGLACEVEDVEKLVRMTTGAESQELAEATWMQGIVALRTSAMLNHQGINSGWDSLEAMALKHLNTALQGVKKADPDKMLRIAVAANAARRRARGEGMSGPRVGVNVGPGGVSVEVGTTLKSGDVGVMKLNLSPAIREQMGDSARVIEGTALRGEAARQKGTADLERLEMLRIGEVRELLDGEEDESKGKVKNAISQEDVKDIMGDFYNSLGEDE